jgi:transposase
MQSIFKRRNPDVEALFQSAGQPQKVMCVAFDYAKAAHTAAICDGTGRRLRGAFNVLNNLPGLDFLLGIVAGLCRKHRMTLKHVFFGGEDCGPYAFNFIHALVKRGFLVIGCNSKLAKHERENTTASTDAIDTVGVAGLMLKMKGRTIGPQSEDVHVIRRLRRQRGALVKAHSASAHRLHGLVDQLFPGFFDEKRSGLTPFSRVSLWLMEERFSAEEVHARKRPALLLKLRELCCADPEGGADKLKVLAEEALPAPARMIPSLQRCLREELALYRALAGSIHALDNDIAKTLAVTPGAMLTTIPGIGLCWAAGLYCELADPLRRRHVDSMCALAGIVPGAKQSGGPEKPAVTRHRTKQCNHFLKAILVSAAVSVAQYGHPEMREAFRTDKALGRDARMRLARQLLRISLYMVDHQTFFLPPSLHRGGTPEAIRDYYLHMWPKVLIKWRDAGAILEAVADKSPLGVWRHMAEELYGIELSTKSPQTGRKRTED